MMSLAGARPLRRYPITPNHRPDEFSDLPQHLLRRPRPPARLPENRFEV